MSQVSTAPIAKATTRIAGTKSGNGNNELIAAPATGNHIVLVAVTLQNESTTATTMQLTEGNGGAAIERVLGQNQGDGVARVYPIDCRPKIASGVSLVLNLSGANSCGYTIHYYVEADGTP